MLPDKSSEILEKINRGDHVHFFYKKFDTHGFGCSYLFRKFFIKHDMLDVLDLHPVRDTETIDCKNKSYVFLCDIDITPTMIFKLCIKAKHVYVIDSKESTVKHLIPKYKENKLIAHTNLTFIHYDNVSPIALIWKLLADQAPAPAFVRDLNNSYQSEIGVLDNNRFSIMKNLSSNYSEWDEITDEEFYLTQGMSHALDNFSVINAKNINLRNSQAIQINKFKGFLINVNKESMDEVGIMASLACDIVVTYEKNDDGYYYRVYTAKSEDINLLLVFNKYNCFGYSGRVWFKHKDFIFSSKKSFLKRLKELFLP